MIELFFTVIALLWLSFFTGVALAIFVVAFLSSSSVSSKPKVWWVLVTITAIAQVLFYFCL